MTDTSSPSAEVKYPCLLFVDVQVTATRVPALPKSFVLELLTSHLRDVGVNYSLKPDSITKWILRPDGVSLLLQGDARYHLNAHIRCAKYFDAKLPYLRHVVNLTHPHEGGSIIIEGKVIAGPVSELQSLYSP
nr:TPA_asm: hypothetical protein [Clonorhabdovirus 2]